MPANALSVSCVLFQHAYCRMFHAPLLIIFTHAAHAGHMHTQAQHKNMENEESFPCTLGVPL